MDIMIIQMDKIFIQMDKIINTVIRFCYDKVTYASPLQFYFFLSLVASVVDYRMYILQVNIHKASE